MERKPNIICILSDDQGTWAAGCYGNPEIRTPHIDRLANEGVRLTHFFVASPVCSPSRATLLTGTIPSQHGVHDFLSHPTCVGDQALPFLEGQTTYTDVLVKHGYICGISGKWHLGASTLPQHGFSDWFVHQFGGGPYHNAPMVRNGELVNEPGYITDVITDEALVMLEKYHKQDKPFYLSVHYTAPHSPWIDHHPQDIVDSYDNCAFKSCPQEPIHPNANNLTKNHWGNREALKGYFASVTAMDNNIGRILDYLDEHDLRKDTLIIFLSDNGFSAGHKGFWGKGNGTYPRNMYENSIKVPCIFSHPGRLPEGKVSEDLLSSYDFMPSLLDYLGLPLPDEKKRPGSSFMPLLREEIQQDREAVFIFDEYGPTRMVRTQDWKYVYRHEYEFNELYDLKNDPHENNNLIGSPNHQDRMTELKNKLDTWFAEYEIEQLSGYHNRDNPENTGQPERLY